MTIPREDNLAFFPPERAAGNVALAPLTIGGAVRLAALGLDFAKPVPRDLVFKAAFVLAAPAGRACRAATAALSTKHQALSTKHDLARFLRHYKGGLQELSNAVETVLNDAFETFVRPAAQKGGAVALTPTGLGWPLELAEFLCAEYGWPFQSALDTPVATAYALLAAAHQRHDGKFAGMDYLQRDYANSLKRKRNG